MKKKIGKLSLNKETVRNLTDEELKGVAGATGQTCNQNTCAASCNGTCGAGCNLSVIVCPHTDGDSTCSGPGCP